MAKELATIVIYQRNGNVFGRVYKPDMSELYYETPRNVYNTIDIVRKLCTDYCDYESKFIFHTETKNENV